MVTEGNNYSKVMVIKSAFILFSLIVLVGFVSATTLNVLSSELSVKNNAIAELSGQVAHLETTGTVGSGDEARIVIQASDVGISTLNDLTSISWDASDVTGYTPHVDVFLDNGKTLVFEYAKVNPSDCDDSADYPTGTVDTFDDKGIVDDSAYAWLSSGPAGPCGDSAFDLNHNSLSEWKTSDGAVEVTKIEIEIDNWISQSEAYVDNIQINGESIILDSIQEAIDVATSGATINVAAGTYEEKLNLQGKSLIINGDGIGSTIIDASSETSYAISNFGDSTTIRDLTLKGTPDSYGFKISGASNIILENIVVEDSYRTGIDLHTINGATLNNIEITNTDWGFGLMILDSSDITVTDITTSGNVWGGVSVQTRDAVSNNIDFNGIFDVQEDWALLLEKDPTEYYDITNVDIPSKFHYVVYDFRAPDNYKQWYYFETLDNAKTTAQNFVASLDPIYSDILIYDITEENYYVEDGMLIQDAITDATAGDIIYVEDGTYNENIVIAKSLIVKGANAGIVATETRGSESVIDAQLADFGVFIYGAETVATFDGFTVENYEVGGILAGAFSPPEEDPLEVHILNNIIEAPSPLIDAHNNNIQVGDGTTGTIIGNKVFGAHLEDPDWSGSGIIVASSNDVLISNNYAYSCDIGIAIIGYTIELTPFRPPSENNIIEYNFVENCGAGIGVQRNAIGTIIRYNDVSNNDVGIESAGYPDDVPSGTEIHFNNIVSNLEYGVASIIWGADPGVPERVDAINNWWGCNEGPGEDVCDSVSDNVDYDPWIKKVEDVPVTTTENTPAPIDTTGTDTNITLTTSTSQSGTITVQQHGSDIHGGFSASALGKFINIESTISDKDITEVEIRIYYTDEELLVAGLDETTLKIYWWDGDSWEFEGTIEGCHDAVGCYGVDTINNYVWIVTDHFSDYGAGGEEDTEGPIIGEPTLSQPYPNPADDEFTIYVYVNITDPSGVKDYPELAWKIKDRESTIIYDSGETTMNPLEDLYYGGITAPKIDGLEIIYKITAEDNLDNSGESSADYEHLFYYDGLAPNTTLIIDESEYEYEDTIYVTSATEFTLTCDDGENGNGCNKTYYQINEGEIVEDVAPYSFTIPGDDGEYTIYYYSIDNSNNFEEINSQTVILDNTAPETTDSSSSEWTNENVFIELLSSDGIGSGVDVTKYCTYNEGDSACTPSETYTEPIQVTCAEDSVCEQYINYQSIDNLENVEGTKTSNLIRIDKALPVLTINEGTDTGPVANDVINLDVTDDSLDLSSLKYGFSGDAVCNGDNIYEYSFNSGEDFIITGDANIDYLCAVASDLAGNTVYEFIGQLNIDGTSPNLISVSISSSNSYSGLAKVGDTITIAFTSNEDLQTPIVIIDGNSADVTGSETSWSSTYTMQSEDTEGTIEFAIDFEDLAGNAGTTVTTTSNSGFVIFDKTNPSGELTGVPIDWTNEIAEIGLTCDDANDCDDSENYLTIVPFGGSCDATETYTGEISVSEHSTACWKVTDNVGNIAIGSSEIMVDKIVPTITRNGDAEITIEVHSTYNDDGATATDNIDGDLTSSILTINPVDTSTVGDYTVTYNVQDSAGNDAVQVTRTVHVVDTTKPVITLIGNVEITLEAGIDSYTELGATALDNYDGDISDSIAIGGDTVDANTIGDYTITYDVQDSAGNDAVQVTRTVHVVDTTAPTVEDDYANDGIWVNSVPQTVTLNPQDAGSGIDTVKYCESSGCIPSMLLTSPYQLTFDTSQDTIVRYQAWDVMENPSAIEEFNVKIDTVQPIIKAISPGGPLNTSEITLFVKTNEETLCRYGLTLEENFYDMAYPLGDELVESVNHSEAVILEDDEYLYRIKCKDKAGNEITDTVSFEIDTSGSYATTIALDANWNSFTLPKFLLNLWGYTTPESRSPANILASLDGNYEILWYYDGTTWLHYDPNAEPYENSLIEFNDQISSPYWIKMTAPDRLEIPYYT